MHQRKWNVVIIIALLAFVILNSAGKSAAFDGHVIESQTYTPHNPIHIDGNADFLAQDAAEGWPGNGSSESPIIISGFSFAAAEHMLRVQNADLHFKFIDNQLDGLSYEWCGVACLNAANGVIKDNYVRRAAAGIHVVAVENFTIQGNEVHDSSFSGIVVEDGSTNVTVLNNIVYGNADYGIHIGNPYGSDVSRDVKIIGNTVYENSPSGITLLEADNCTVEYNEIYSNDVNGIEVHSGSHWISYNNITDSYIGIFLQEGNATITHNEIMHGDYGISVATEYNTISYNELAYNEYDGLRFYYLYETGVGGSYNFITRNVMGNNSRWGMNFGWNTTMNIATSNYLFGNGDNCQANNDGESNTIDGNYWNDWTSPDANDDSIVDVPYEIEGDAESNDPNPMTIPDIWIDPWFSGPCACESETTTTTTDMGNGMLLDPILLTVGASAVVIILIVAVFLRRK